MSIAFNKFKTPQIAWEHTKNSTLANKFIYDSHLTFFIFHKGLFHFGLQLLKPSM